MCSYELSNSTVVCYVVWLSVSSLSSSEQLIKICSKELSLRFCLGVGFLGLWPWMIGIWGSYVLWLLFASFWKKGCFDRISRQFLDKLRSSLAVRFAIVVYRQVLALVLSCVYCKVLIAASYLLCSVIKFIVKLQPRISSASVWALSMRKMSSSDSLACAYWLICM